MNFFKNLNWKEVFLTFLALLVVSTHAQIDVGQLTPGGSLRTCDRLRQDISLLFEQIYEKMPSLLNIMMDAAQDPNSGKRVDFGVDVMKRMIVNAFTSFLPVCAHPRQIIEQGELVKTSIPAWYFSNLQRSQNAPPKIYAKGTGQKQMLESIPLKLRRKRSSSSYDGKHGSDGLMIGDAFIPLEMLQHQDSGNEEEKNQITLELYV